MLARVLHLVRYDLRSVAPIAAVWIGVLALESLVYWIGPALPDPASRDVVRLDLAAIVMRFAVTVVLVATLVHRHLLVGSTAFWRTRPMVRVDLLAAKATSTLLLCVAVPFAWFALTFFLLGVAPEGAARAAGYMALEQTLVVSLAFVLASVSSNLAQIVIGGVAMIVLYTLGRDFVHPRVRTPLAFAIPVQSGETVEVVMWGLVALLLLAAAAHQFLSLRTRRSMTVLLFVIVGFVLLLRYPIWKVVAAPMPEAAVPAPDLALDGGSIHSEHFVRIDDTGRTTGVRYRVQVKDAGAPGPVILAPSSVASTVTFADGTVEQWTSPSQTSPLQPAPVSDATLADQPYPSLAAAIDGTLLVDPRDIAGQRYWLWFLEISDAAFAARRRQPAALEIHLNGVAYRYAASARLPLDAGARTGTSEWVITFKGRVPSMEGVALDVVQWILPPWQPVAPARVLLHNRATGEALLLSTGRETQMSTTLMLYGGLRVRRDRLEARLVDRPALGSVNEAWLSGAELVLVRPRVLGKTASTIRVDQFLLDPSSEIDVDPAGVLRPPGGAR